MKMKHVGLCASCELFGREGGREGAPAVRKHGAIFNSSVGSLGHSGGEFNHNVTVELQDCETTVKAHWPFFFYYTSDSHMEIHFV